jgi:hypothetical protein
VAHDLQQGLPQILRRDAIVFEKHERGNDFAARLVGSADRSAFGHCRVLEKRRFHLDGADAVSGDFDNFVGAAGEPDVAVVVDVRRIASWKSCA